MELRSTPLWRLFARRSPHSRNNHARDKVFHLDLSGYVRTGLPVLLVGASLLISSGCSSTPNPHQDSKITRELRIAPHPDYPSAVNQWRQRRENDRLLKDFVLAGMCEMSAAILAGQYESAREIGILSYYAITRFEDEGSEIRAALGNEAVKFFKGEPHERELAFFYTGLMCYLEGDYNNARIFFQQATLATATRDEDMIDFRDDYALGHYWLARAHLKLGDHDNARIGLTKARPKIVHPNEVRESNSWKQNRVSQRKRELELEAQCFKNATNGKKLVPGVIDLSQRVVRSERPSALSTASLSSPVIRTAGSRDDFLTLDFQENVNLILVIELGQGPYKYLTGSGNAIDKMAKYPHQNFDDCADVYIDGHFAGPAIELCDTYHQAFTRGVKTRRERQIGKAVVRKILQHTPFVGDLASLWNIQADHRHWATLPGKLVVFAAEVEPGLRHVSIRFYDANEEYLPRYDMTRHFLPVPERGEAVYLLHSRENEENAFVMAVDRKKGK